VFTRKENGERLPHSLVFAGHVVDYKGVDIALQAFALLRQRYADARFSIFGRTLSWQETREHLFRSNWLDSVGRPAWSSIESALPGVRYCGEVNQAELAEALRRHSLLVMPSRAAETFGIVSLEAQACGCIPVLPRKGGFPETLKEGETGYLYSGDQPEALAAAIVRLWDNDLPRESQRAAAQRWVAGAFSREAMCSGSFVCREGRC
jgi:glycosyltransferase involved in cell wall biosynthesis